MRFSKLFLLLLLFIGLQGMIINQSLANEEKQDDKEWLRKKIERVNPLYKQMKTLKEEGKFTAARETAQKMIKAAEEEYGPYYLYIFDGLLVIWESYASENRYPEADEAFQQLFQRIEDLNFFLSIINLYFQ